MLSDSIKSWNSYARERDIAVDSNPAPFEAKVSRFNGEVILGCEDFCFYFLIDVCCSTLFCFSFDGIDAQPGENTAQAAAIPPL